MADQTATISTIPGNDSMIYAGQVVQQLINIELNDGNFIDNPSVTISDIANITMLIKSDNGKYTIPIIVDENSPTTGVATFYYSVDIAKGTYKTSFTATYAPTNNSSQVRMSVNGKASVEFTNVTQYIFNVSGSDTLVTPAAGKNFTSQYKLNVVDPIGNPIRNYNLYLYSDTNLLSQGAVFTDDVNNGYKQLSPVSKTYIPSLDTNYYQATTDSNGNLNFYFTAQNEMCAGNMHLLTDVYSHEFLGSVIVYDSDPYAAKIFVEPEIMGPIYLGGKINVSEMDDPLNARIPNYLGGVASDQIILMINGIFAQSATYKQLFNNNPVISSLTFPKASLKQNNDGSLNTTDKNDLLFIVMTDTGVVRTSDTNAFVVTGGVQPNKPGDEVAVPPPPNIEITGQYINADNYQGGVTVQFPLTPGVHTPAANDILTITYYMNGYIPGTNVPKSSKQNVAPYTLLQADIDRGYYEYKIPASEFQGYDSSTPSGAAQKFYIQYSITFVKSNAQKILYQYASKFLDTVAPGDFG